MKTMSGEHGGILSLGLTAGEFYVTYSGCAFFSTFAFSLSNVVIIQHYTALVLDE
jgi:hypothetical protein